jgi:hypothetical protein
MAPLNNLNLVDAIFAARYFGGAYQYTGQGF